MKGAKESCPAVAVHPSHLSTEQKRAARGSGVFNMKEIQQGYRRMPGLPGRGKKIRPIR
jgi:hypothetical protein